MTIAAFLSLSVLAILGLARAVPVPLEPTVAGAAPSPGSVDEVATSDDWGGWPWFPLRRNLMNEEPSMTGLPSSAVDEVATSDDWGSWPCFPLRRNLMNEEPSMTGRPSSAVDEVATSDDWGSWPWLPLRRDLMNEEPSMTGRPSSAAVDVATSDDWGSWPWLPLRRDLMNEEPSMTGRPSSVAVMDHYKDDYFREHMGDDYEDPVNPVGGEPPAKGAARRLRRPTAASDVSLDDRVADDIPLWSTKGADLGEPRRLKAETNDDWYRIHLDDDFTGLPRGDDFFRVLEVDEEATAGGEEVGEEEGADHNAHVESRHLPVQSKVERGAGDAAPRKLSRRLRGRRSSRET